MNDFVQGGATPPLDWNGPTSHPFRPLSAHDLEKPVFEVFCEVVQRWEGRPAVRDHRGEATYGDLLTLARSIASSLGEADSQGPLVGIALQVDRRIPAAMLGALAAGRAYVPLDFSQPAERLAHIVSHSGLRSVMASAETMDVILAAVPPTCRVIDVDHLAPVPATWQPAGAVTDLAYLLYTSGSTGRPKGVYQSQRGLMHDVMQYTNSVHFSERDVTSGLYSPGVNGAIRDIYGALLNGGCLCMVDLRRDGFTVAAERMADAGITIFHAMPPVLRSLLGEVRDRAMMQRVRLAYVAGDRFWGSDVQLLREALPDDALLYTGIGSTECATLYRQWFVPPDWPIDDGLIPVGYAVPDRDVRLVGDDGVIEVDSAYLARGYWNDGALTEQVFTPSPIDPGLVTFRTGDRGRLRPDGLMEFMGRADRQVKIRGYRVELGDVEAVLRGVAGVTDAAVVARGDDDSCRLVAFLAAGEATRDSLDVTSALKSRLPVYMHPANVVVMPALPRLGNGKLDSKQLEVLADTSLASGAATADSAQTPPNDAVLARVIAEWTRILHLPAAGTNDAWTASGGDSLTALELIVALENAFTLTLPASLITSETTPLSLTDVLRAVMDSPASGADAGERAGAFFIVPWAPGPSVHDRRLAETLGSHFRVESLQLTTLDEELVMVRSISDLARNCAAHITATTSPATPLFIIGISFGGRIAFELASRLRAQGRNVAFVAVGDVAPQSGYLELSRQAWRAKYAQETRELGWWRQGVRRVTTQLRLGVGWIIRSLARLSWQAPLRVTTRAGIAVFGAPFRGGAGAAIRQSRVQSWVIPHYPGELVLFLTDSTPFFLNDARPTLGWDRYARSVRVVRVEGHHSDFFGEEFGPAFAQQVLAAALESIHGPDAYLEDRR